MSSGEPTHPVSLEQAQGDARRVITEGYAQDLIDTDELDRRLEAVERATATDEIATLCADLPAPKLHEPPQTALAPLGDVPTHATITAVLSETKRTGPWTPARHTKLRAALASTRLDLRHALLGPGVTEIEVGVFMAEVEIIVTPGTVVELTCSAILGEVAQDDRMQVSTAPNAPRIRITGTVVLGNVSVRERLDGESWWAARGRRKQERKRLKQERKARQRALSEPS